MNRYVFPSVLLLLLLGALACSRLTGGDETNPEGAGIATPTLKPTVTPDVNATLIASIPTPITPESDPNDAATGQSAPGGGSVVGSETPAPGGSESGGGGGENGDGSGGGGNGNGNGGGGPVAAGCPAGGTNLALNPSFEGEYKPWATIRELNMAAQWFPWFKDDGSNSRPEFKPAEAAQFPNRVHSGAKAQQYFKSFGTFISGVSQSVLNVTKGSRIQFSAYGQAWSCLDSDLCKDATSVDPANMLMRVGIDPFGGTDPFSGDIIWSAYFNPLDHWEVACVETAAQAEIVTVYLWASPDGPRNNQDVYWDDASFVVLP